MKTLAERYVGFAQVRQSPVPKSGLTRVQTYEYCSEMISNSIQRYRKLGQMGQIALLTRQDIAHWLRIYHETMGACYREVGINFIKGKKDFEHVIPVAQLIGLLIADRMSIDEALRAPTCLLRARYHKQVDKRFQDTTPDLINFWQRYLLTIGNVKIETNEGDIIDMNLWNLNKHYEYITYIYS